MNMPMHIMAKPIQTVAVTAAVALFSVAEIIAGPVRTLAAERSIPAHPLRHKPAATDIQTGMGVLRCPILGQSDRGEAIFYEIQPI